MVSGDSELKVRVEGRHVHGLEVAVLEKDGMADAVAVDIDIGLIEDADVFELRHISSFG